MPRRASSNRVSPWSAFFAALLVGIAAAACAEVPSYSRGRLAHPTMNAQFAQSAARDHREAVQEGATGGGLGASSGCGCN